MKLNLPKVGDIWNFDWASNPLNFKIINITKDNIYASTNYRDGCSFKLNEIYRELMGGYRRTVI